MPRPWRSTSRHLAAPLPQRIRAGRGASPPDRGPLRPGQRLGSLANTATFDRVDLSTDQRSLWHRIIELDHLHNNQPLPRPFRRDRGTFALSHSAYRLLQLSTRRPKAGPDWSLTRWCTVCTS